MHDGRGSPSPRGPCLTFSRRGRACAVVVSPLGRRMQSRDRRGGVAERTLFGNLKLRRPKVRAGTAQCALPARCACAVRAMSGRQRARARSAWQHYRQSAARPRRRPPRRRLQPTGRRSAALVASTRTASGADQAGRPSSDAAARAAGRGHDRRRRRDNRCALREDRARRVHPPPSGGDIADGSRLAHRIPADVADAAPAAPPAGVWRSSAPPGGGIVVAASAPSGIGGTDSATVGVRRISW